MKHRKGVPVLALGLILAPPVLGFFSPFRSPIAPKQHKLTCHVYVSIPSLSLDQYIAASTDIVRATVVGRRAVFPDDGIAYTEVDLTVNWALKGTAQGLLTIHIPGAEDDTRITTADHCPCLTIGDDVFVALALDGESGILGVMGLDQGVFHVVTDSDRQEHVVGVDTNNSTPTDFIARLSGQ